MTDVFISYSRSDRLIAAKTAALLESHGFRTWWDTSLEPGDKFRDKIMAEIDACCATVVIWTPNSVASDFVRGEAGRARQQKKLIPISVDVVSDQIPVPFNEIHTEPIENEPGLVATVEGFVEKSKLKSPLLRRIWASARYEVLAWLSIFFAALTLVANLGSLITLAHWIQELVDKWFELLVLIWKNILFFVPHISRADAVVLSVVSFLCASILFSRQRYQRTSNPSFGQFFKLSIGVSVLFVFFCLNMFFGLDQDLLAEKLDGAPSGLVWFGLGPIGQFSAQLSKYFVTVPEGDTYGMYLSDYIYANDGPINDFIEFHQWAMGATAVDLTIFLILLFIAASLAIWIANRTKLITIDLNLLNKRVWRVISAIVIILSLNGASIWVEELISTTSAFEEQEPETLTPPKPTPASRS